MADLDKDARIAELGEALRPFACRGGPKDGSLPIPVEHARRACVVLTGSDPLLAAELELGRAYVAYRDTLEGGDLLSIEREQGHRDVALTRVRKLRKKKSDTSVRQGG